MNLTSLDMTLNRIHTIENQFQSLMSYGTEKPTENFQKILDTTMENKKNSNPASKNEINDLISKYSEEAGLDVDFVKAVINQESGFNPNAKSKRIILKGDIPSPANPPKGCKFCTRCPKVMEICKHIEPEYKEIEGHIVACHLYDEK